MNSPTDAEPAPSERPIGGGASALDRGLSPVASTSPPRKAWLVGVGGAGLLALLVAIQAPGSESRSPAAEGRSRGVRPEAPPLDPLPEAEPSPAQSAVGSAATPPSPLAQEFVLDLQRRALKDADASRRRAAERQRSPMVLFDGSALKGAGERRAGDASRGAARRSGAPEGRLDRLQAESAQDPGELGREERFAKRAALEPVETVRAERVENPSTLVPQGTFIQGVLETEIQSDLPGMIRAQVSAPVRAFDGTLVVPAGSRLIGRYQSGLVRGQTRVFVIWTRLLRPDGVSMRIDSPGTDVLGRAGVSGSVDTHFFEIFGSSILLSLLHGGLDIAAANAQDGGSTVIQTGGDNLNRAAEIALQNRITVAPTIRIPRGTQIQVVVSKDLDFVGTDSRMD